MGKDTVAIVDRGWYETERSGRVDISAAVRGCLDATKLFTPQDLDQLSTAVPSGNCQTTFVVANETSLSAARRLVVNNMCVKTLCLNFASAKNPGGGFLGGSQAQEESLARSSALYTSLITQSGYYEANRECRTSLYTDHAILSPGVPVFRDDDGELLAAPYSVGMLTSPAVNAGAIQKNEPQKVPLIRPTMASRIAKVLAVAGHHGYEHLVLGAWGCGVFRNNASEIAELFAAALRNQGQFAKNFQSATFAVLDHSEDEHIIGPFRDQFSEAT